MWYHAVVFKDAQASFECASMSLAMGRMPVSIALCCYISLSYGFGDKTGTTGLLLPTGMSGNCSKVATVISSCQGVIFKVNAAGDW